MDASKVKLIREALIEIGEKRYTMVSDDDYLNQHANGFEPHMVQLFTVLASNSNVILDVGANIGCTALLFGTLSQTVHAFEPSPTTFAFLEKNVSRSGLQNVFAHNIGLGAESTETTLTFAPSNRSGAFVSNQIQASAGHTIEKIIVRRLDQVMTDLSLPRIDFLKIDVEGFEGCVLRGASETLASNKPLVVMELNHWCLNAFQRTSVPDFLDILRSIFPILLAVDGLNCKNLHDESDSYHVMYHHILHMRYPNIVAAFDENRISEFRSVYREAFVD